MSVRELVVLGTGAEVPSPERNLHGLLIRWDEHGLLLDPGEGTQRQMIYADVTATSLTGVFISSFRPDACLGLAGICQRISLDRVPHPIPVYFPRSGQVFYERLRKASVYHAAARLDPRPVPDLADSESAGPEEIVVHADSKIELRTRRLEHGLECWGLRLQEKDRRTMLPDKLKEVGVMGPDIKRLQTEGKLEVGGHWVQLEDVSVHRPGQAVAYLGPTRPGQAALELMRGASVAVCHAACLEVADAERSGRMTASEAGRLAEAAQIETLVLTGFGPGAPEPSDLVQDARSMFSGEVLAASDGDRIPIKKPSKKSTGKV